MRRWTQHTELTGLAVANLHLSADTPTSSRLGAKVQGTDLESGGEVKASAGKHKL
jgi:hypothetical protein